MEVHVPVPLTRFAFRGQPAYPFQPRFAPQSLHLVAAIRPDVEWHLPSGRTALTEVMKVLHASILSVEGYLRRWCDLSEHRHDHEHRDQNEDAHRSVRPHGSHLPYVVATELSESQSHLPLPYPVRAVLLIEPLIFRPYWRMGSRLPTGSNSARRGSGQALWRGRRGHHARLRLDSVQ